MAEKFIVGLYDCDEKVIQAVENIRARGIQIDEVYMPFPAHGMNEALGIKDSRLPDAGFMFGAIGTTLALTMQTYMYTFDWKINVGGKPDFPLPSFIPITFELTVLLCALGMVFTFYAISDLYPGKKAKVFDLRQTDDRFVVAIKASSSEKDKNAEQALSETGAIEVRVQELT